MNYQRWTKEEEDILVQTVSSYPHNLGLGFKEASTKLNRTKSSCSAHWYFITKDSKKVTLLTISSKKLVKNRKNISSLVTNRVEQHTLWFRIKRLFKL